MSFVNDENFVSIGGRGGADALSVLPQIQPGIEEVTVNVSVTYEIK